MMIQRAIVALKGPTISLVTMTDDRYAMPKKIAFIRVTFRWSETNWQPKGFSFKYLKIKTNRMPVDAVMEKYIAMSAKFILIVFSRLQEVLLLCRPD